MAVDIYVNETTRHADVILPAPSALQKGHYDVALLQLALHNTSNYSEPVLPLDPDQPDEWEVLARLALVLQGAGATADPGIVDDLMITSMVQGSVGDETSPIHGRDPEEILEALAPRRGPERLLDFLLRTGPYGEGFGADPDGLSLDKLLANPHGVDLGALQARLPDVLRTPDGMIALAPEILVADVARLHDGLDGRRDHPFVLIGRRDLRSNNSWMHNVSVLVKGKPRCTAHLHPDDAAALGLADGDDVIVRSRVGEVRVPVEVTDAIRPGVVEHPARLGPRPPWRAAGGRRRARGGQQQPARRRDAVRPDLRQRRAQRHPRGGPRGRVRRREAVVTSAGAHLGHAVEDHVGRDRRVVEVGLPGRHADPHRRRPTPLGGAAPDPPVGLDRGDHRFGGRPVVDPDEDLVEHDVVQDGETAGLEPLRDRLRRVARPRDQVGDALGGRACGGPPTPRPGGPAATTAASGAWRRSPRSDGR